jgi:hypothetical protein
MEPLTLILVFLAVFFANVYASSVGGASLLILPALFLAGVPADIAIGTNRLHRIFATGTSLYKYSREVQLERKSVLLYSAVSAIGAIIGAFVVLNLDQQFLKFIVSIFLILLTVFFLLKRDLGLKGDKGKKTDNNLTSSIVLFLIAFYRSIVGSAAGTFLRVYMVLKHGMTFIEAAAYCSFIALASNVFAVVVFIWGGLIDYWLAFYMIIAGISGAYVGAHLALKKGNVFVRRLFLVIVMLTSAKILFDILLPAIT